MPPGFNFPTRPTAEERAAGALTPDRRQQIEAAGRHLKRCRSVERAAEEAGLTVASYTRNFAEMAKLAGWTSRTPADYLAGRPTRRGGARAGAGAPGSGGAPRTDAPLTVQWGCRLSEEASALLGEALGRFQGTSSDFLAEAARRFLAAKRPW